MNDAQTRYTLALNTVATVQIQTVQYEFIRIQILDCRSWESIPNCRVKKIIVRAGAKTFTTEFIKDDKKITGNTITDSQKALKQLGIFKGTPNTTYSADSITAFNDYWKNRANGEVPVASATKSPAEAHYSLITKEYNSHYETDANGILTLRIPQNFFDGNRVEVEVGLWNCPIILEEILNDSRNSSAHPPVFRESGIFPLRFAEPNFKIVWTGRAQSTAWNGTWGWEAQVPAQRVANTNTSQNSWASNQQPINPPNPEPRTEFKVSELLVIKNNTGSFNNNSVVDTSNMSIFYNSKESNSPHFVLFAMQWCQPVWDGIDDPTGELEAGSSNDNCYIQDAQYANLNMHIVTNYAGSGIINGQTVTTYGKTYGTTRHETLAWFDVDSVDMMTGPQGTIHIFAIHAGLCTRLRGNATGQYISLMCENPVFGTNDNKRGIRYLHLHSYVIANNTNAMAGQIVGMAGRTDIPATYPDHCHMDFGAGEINHLAAILNHRDEVDEYNRICIPHYDLPLIFPCRSERAHSISTCNFSCSTAQNCWAAIELKCPSMVGKSNAATDSQQFRVIQAQLMYLGYYNSILDNSNGPGTKEAIKKYKNNDSRGITPNYYPCFPDNRPRPIMNGDPNDPDSRETAFLNANDQDNKITDLLLTWLNTEAPLPTI